MLTGLLLITLSVPYQPVLEDPLPEGWSRGQGGAFVTNDFGDDAGVGPSSTLLEFRPEDAGYGSMDQTFPYNRYTYPSLPFPAEGERYCWRATHINTLNQSSPPSAEQCFRVDFTPPTGPAFVDAGAISSAGKVAIELQPATDNLSGVRGYFLELAPAPLGPYVGLLFAERQLPLIAYLGEGNWYGWVRVTDRAGNDNRVQLAEYTIPITVTAFSTVAVPEAPAFVDTMVNGYGDALRWDAGWMGAAGVTHVVSSFCRVSDAGCQWQHGFHSLPLTNGSWLQVEEEGTFIARLAVVQGDNVGNWSPPSGQLMVDRTAPPTPSSLVAVPQVARTGPISLQWAAAPDDLTGLAQTSITETPVLGGAPRTLSAPAPAVSFSVTPAGDGVYRYVVASIDRVGNRSGLSGSVDVVIDGTGPVAQAPIAAASAIDGGAMVSITWQLPVDLLSGVVSEELEERNDDGGTQLVSVTGLGASRLVPPGRWRWALRGIDALSNVGAFSPPSNLIVVTGSGVVVGPSIGTTSLTARCGEPLTVRLQGAGDLPLQWELLSGPPNLVVNTDGSLSWTPPAAQASVEMLNVRLTNPVTHVEGTVAVDVSCDVAPVADAGVDPQPKNLLVACGCSSFEGGAGLLALLFLARRRR